MNAKPVASWPFPRAARALALARTIPPAVALALGMLAALLVYLPSLDDEWHFDDREQVLEEPAIRRPGYAASQFTSRERFFNRGLYRATVGLCYALPGGHDPATGEPRPFVFHAANVVVHLLNAALLFQLLRAVMREGRVARREFVRRHAPGLAAAIWALHPLSTQAVNFVTLRAETLATTFVFAGLLALLRAARAAPAGLPGPASTPGAPPDAPGRLWPWRAAGWTAAAMLLAALGAGAKSVAVMIVPLALVIVPWAVAPSRARRVVLLSLAVIAAAGGAALLWLLAASGQVEGSAAGAPISAERWRFVQPWTVARYLGLLVWPDGLRIDYHAGLPWFFSRAVARAQPRLTAADFPPLALGLSPAVWFTALHAGLLAAALAAWRRFAVAWAAFGLLFFYAAVAPSSSVVARFDLAFEYRAYAASAGVCFALACAILALAEAAGRRWAGVHPGATAFGWSAILCGALAVLTLARGADYDTELALWRDTVWKNPDNNRGRVNLGNALARAGDDSRAREPARARRLYDAALAQYRQALDLTPPGLFYDDAWGNLVSAARQAEQWSAVLDVIDQWRRARAAAGLEPQPTRFLGASGEARLELGALDPAWRDLRRHLESGGWPRHRLDRANYGRACILLGVQRDDPALVRSGRTIAEQALALGEFHTGAGPSALPEKWALAAACDFLGEAHKAYERFMELAALEPARAEPLVRAGRVAAARGEAPAARRHLLDALAREPRCAPAALELGRLEAGQNNVPAARQWLARAAALDPEGAAPLAESGLLEESAGDLAAAERAYQQALAKDPASPRLRQRLADLLIRRARGG
ncbi:MAG: hypothetical protein HY719_07655 [Planctomycetes bacterium]|nr:hypothetical protein [Planctomycetota bacterium]